VLGLDRTTSPRIVIAQDKEGPRQGSRWATNSQPSGAPSARQIGQGLLGCIEPAQPAGGLLIDNRRSRIADAGGGDFLKPALLRESRALVGALFRGFHVISSCYLINRHHAHQGSRKLPRVAGAYIWIASDSLLLTSRVRYQQTDSVQSRGGAISRFRAVVTRRPLACCKPRVGLWNAL
jgi:hypothetical protein